MEPEYIKLNEIKPVLSGYIRESRALLKQRSVPDEDMIHDVRVLMKKARAAIKLAAPQLENESVAKDIVALREVGRTMCSWRETYVNRKILKELRKEFGGIFAILSNDDRINSILKKPDTGNEPSETMKTGLEEVSELINKTGYRIRFYSMSKIDPRLLIKELELTYLKVVDNFQTCRNNTTPINIHEFRKIAKTFLYQLYFFRPLNPSVIKALEKKLDRMTMYLGRYNDLAQIVKTMDYKYSQNKNLPAMDELVIRIREKQDICLVKVWPTAFKIFCPGTKLVNLLGYKILII